ncbi:cytochrome c1 [Parasphingorhabdus flavimaris]|jgi:ubiquinol-cytochrome c reductase cytochrome c1 subunit|uniref:Cytochrome c1 n=1 Tax=Parasphingorhabdus flavimaris TaxID=266812 RepID=A0ABX2N2I4_9SPHN|nr:cytochrome c1 [Parasphingorhabdus flavimaris]NVD27916.1 cytochrome c1 [Parasphingorhabdus flavimaris]|tara:strand:+ start:15751 stop:16611 length:861 start_codon:yes stop_codon:yes gene_type:complete
MVRIIGILIGLFFSGWLLVSFGMGAKEYITNPPVETAEHAFHKEAKDVSFTSDGPLGKFDRQQLQRGFQVYKEVCAACHSLRLVAFRNLEEIGYNEDEVKAIAANWPIQTPDVDPATGEMSTRASVAADKLPKPFANDVAAGAANNNAIPPDLSLITKAREGGAPYIYSLLTGYQAPPADLPKANQPGPGLHYNPYFANLNLAMAPPLAAADMVSYSDGTKASIDQMAKDVSAFLIWSAEPKLEERHQAGWAVLAFLLIATILAYLSYRTIWADVKAEKKKKSAEA